MALDEIKYQTYVQILKRGISTSDGVYRANCSFLLC